jgi:hypothetical protein
MAYIPLNGTTGIEPLGESPVNPVLLITAVETATNAVMNLFTNMTCLYNRYWYEEPDRITFPMCVFHIKKFVETWQNETSRKRVILYTPTRESQDPRADAVPAVRPGVMNTIVDNVVSQPKTYSMEIVLPDKLTGRYVSDALAFLSALLDFTDSFAPNGEDDNGNEEAFGYFENVSNLIRWAQNTYRMLFRGTGLANRFAYSDAKFDRVNKTSLEAMIESNKVLTMKLWYGYEYKYVIITGATIEKNGTEDGIHRATLNLQEVPVLSVNRVKSKQGSANVGSWSTWFKSSSWWQDALMSATMKSLSDVGDASGETIADEEIPK